MLQAILIDDEQASLDLLGYDISLYCPDLQVLDTFTNPAEAFLFLQRNSIDVLFLDISMPGCNGFEFLSKFRKIEFEVIFVTAYEEYALRAFDFYAVDYLLKPTEPEKLIRAIERIKSKQERNRDFERFESLFKNLTISKSSTLAIPTFDGFEMIDLQDLVYLQADGNYTELKMKTKKILVSKTLGDFEKILTSELFLRIHNSYIINIQEVRKYIKGDGGLLNMSNGDQLPVSRINKPKLLSALKTGF